MNAPLEIVPLGGVGEFGRNVLWLRCGESSILVDVGVSFPDETFPGIDRIAPDLSILRKERLDGVFLTHGHEDHIGALSFLREWCDAPVYGFPFTLALARRRLEEAQVSAERLVETQVRVPVRAGAFTVTFFRVSHSVPDSTAMLIEAGGKRIFHSGDFKLDDDPPDGETTDREGIAAAVGAGVDVALVDSTNAERPGHSLSERVAGQGLAAAFAGARGRIILTTFSSHVARVSQGVEAALRAGRRIAILGRSMRSVAEIAERLGRLRLPVGVRQGSSDLRAVAPHRLLCLTSGSQGEPFSALYRLSLGEHADLELAQGDTVILSARTIPGHERSVNRMTDHLVRRGARVVRESEPPIHVSGHAHREEIAEWLRLVKPRAVVPVHGDRRMLAAAAEIAVDAGVPPERVHLLDNGDRLVLSDAVARVEPRAVPCGIVYLDDRPETVDPEVVRDRRQLAEEGVVVILVRGGEVDVVSRGVAAPEAELSQEVARAARAVLARATPEEHADLEWLRAEIAIAAKRACRRALSLRPVIVPVVV
ncbi:MAG: ribonuclease J [Acidobacteriota bacterium]